MTDYKHPSINIIDERLNYHLRHAHILPQFTTRDIKTVCAEIENNRVENRIIDINHSYHLSLEIIDIWDISI